MSWKIGDIVIHEGDRKSSEYLMRVVDIKGNKYITVYIDPWAIVPSCQKRQYKTLRDMPIYLKRSYTKQYKNLESALLAPSLFGINTEGIK